MPASRPRTIGSHAARAAMACLVGGVARLAVAGDLAIDERPDRLVITADGRRPVATFTFGDAAVGRPAIRDLHAPDGTMVTRPCPPRPGIDPKDHPLMHPGVMLCFSDLSGNDPWRGKTAVRFTGFTTPAAIDADGAVRFSFAVEYLAAPHDQPDAPVVCRERSDVLIADRTLAGRPVRLLDWVAELRAATAAVTFADVEEMGFGIRLAKELSPAGAGRYLASHGGRNQEGIFGRQAAWCDASGRDHGGAGVMLVDPGDNPRQAYLHARDYGWLLANAFGRRSYTKGDSGAVVLEPGASLRLHYLLVVHDAVPDDALGPLATAAAASAGKSTPLR